MEFKGLNKSEIKKIEKYSKVRDGEQRVISAYWTEKQEEFEKETGFRTVGCEMMDAGYTKRVENVYISICLWDRRRSFVVKGAENWM